MNISQRLLLDWREKWLHNGHLIGRDFMYSPDGKFVHVLIPKNASGFVRGCFINAGWNESMANNKHIYKEHAIIVYRDPFDRWFSGMAQYLYNLYGKQPKLLDDENLVKHLFAVPVVDDHTEKQIYYIQNIDLNNATFILLGKNINSTLANWFSSNGYNGKIGENARGHDSAEIPVKLSYKQRLHNLMKDDMLQTLFYKAYEDELNFYKYLQGNNLFYK